MLANSASLLLPAPNSPSFYVASSSGLEKVEMLTLRQNSPILSWLRENDGILSRQDLDVVIKFKALTSVEHRVVESLDTELLIPLKSKGQLTGVLVVGPKLSDEDYSGSDINLMRAVVNQTATAIENARHYSEEAERLADLEELEG